MPFVGPFKTWRKRTELEDELKDLLEEGVEIVEKEIHGRMVKVKVYPGAVDVRNRNPLGCVDAKPRGSTEDER